MLQLLAHQIQTPKTYLYSCKQHQVLNVNDMVCISKHALKFNISRCRNKMASECNFLKHIYLGIFQIRKIFRLSKVEPNCRLIHVWYKSSYTFVPFFKDLIFKCLTDKWGNGSKVERSERTQSCQWEHISPAKQPWTARHSRLEKWRLRHSRQEPGIWLNILHEIPLTDKTFHLNFGKIFSYKND